MNPILKIILGLLFLTAILAVPYHVGKNVGKFEVGAEWQKEKEETAEATQKLKDQVADLEQKNQTATTKVADELAKNEQKHAAALADLRTDLTQRLRDSEGRAGVYRRQAQGSTVERDNLASYAAELDRTLEQGRSLVRELRETVKQRDSTIHSLSEQIQADRQLLMSDPNG